MACYGIFDKTTEAVLLERNGEALIFTDLQDAEEFIKGKKDLKIIEVIK